MLPYTPDQLFQLVGDVERYPEFVPWITSMRTWNARDLGEGAGSLDADAGVGFSFLKERFSTRVRRDAANHQIDVDLLSGPFRKLANRWQFEPEGDGATRISFERRHFARRVPPGSRQELSPGGHRLQTDHSGTLISISIPGRNNSGSSSRFRGSRIVQFRFSASATSLIFRIAVTQP